MLQITWPIGYPVLFAAAHSHRNVLFNCSRLAGLFTGQYCGQSDSLFGSWLCLRMALLSHASRQSQPSRFSFPATCLVFNGGVSRSHTRKWPLLLSPAKIASQLRHSTTTTVVVNEQKLDLVGLEAMQQNDTPQPVSKLRHILNTRQLAKYQTNE